MSETKFRIDIELDKDLVVLTTKTVEFLLTKSPDSLALYCFYLKNAKIQKTNSIWNTEKFGIAGLKWGRDRYRKAKMILEKEGFLEETIRRNSKGRIEGHYLKINYIFGKEKTESIRQVIHPVDSTTSSIPTTNALSNKREMLEVIKENIPPELPLKEEGFTLPKARGATPVTRLISIYSTLFNHLYGYKVKSVEYGKIGKVYKDLLNVYSEIQLAWITSVHFDWRGMSGEDSHEEEWLSKNTHGIFQLKGNLSKYEAYIRNVLNQSVEFDDDLKLLQRVANHIGGLK